MNAKSSRPRRFSGKFVTGFSIVELLVAALIGMLAIAAITQSYISSEGTKRALSASGDSIVAGTISLYLLEREARTAGFGLSSTATLGCSVRAVFAGDVSSPAPTDTTVFNPPIFPFQFAPIVIHQGATTDQITILYASSESTGLPVKLTSALPAGAAKMFVSTNYYFNDNGLAILSDGDGGCAMIQVASRDTSMPSLLNLDPKSPWNSSSSLFPKTEFPIGAAVFDMGSLGLKRFFVNSSDSTLRMAEVSMQKTGSLTSTETTILAKGVVGLKAQYGYSASVTSTTVASWSNTAPTSNADWRQLVAVRLAIVLRSPQPSKYKTSPADGTCEQPTPSNMTWSGGTVPIIDSATEATCYRYQVYETTIPIRNRIWTLN
jgi:type IV pilus assembly protein PilW